VPDADRPGVDLVVSELDRWLEPIPVAGAGTPGSPDTLYTGSQAEPVQVEPVQVEPVQVEPVQAEPVPPDQAPADEVVALEAGPSAPAGDADDVKVIGPLRVPIPLFNIYLNEADELSRRLTTEVAEWAMESHRPVGETAVALAHSLGGSSATVGFAELSQLARRFEAVLAQSNEAGYGHPEEGRLFVEVAEEIRRLLHQFAAGFLRNAAPALLERLAEHERGMAERAQARQRADQLVAEDASGETPATAPDRDEWSPAAAPEVQADDLGSPPPVPSLAPPPPAQPDVAWPAGTPSWSPEAVTDRLPVAEATETQPPALDDAGAPTWPDAVELSPSQAAPVEPVVPPALARAEAAATPGLVRFASAAPWQVDEDFDAVDAVDAELFPVFDEEAGELLPELAARLRDWTRQPQQSAPATACLRTLHTLKGGARLAGAMRLGEMAHRMEARIEDLLTALPVSAEALDELHARSDALTAALEALRARDASAYDAAASAVAERMAAEARDGEAPPADRLPGVLPTVEPGVPVQRAAASDAAAEAPATGAAWRDHVAEPSTEPTAEPTAEPSSEPSSEPTGEPADEHPDEHAAVSRVQAVAAAAAADDMRQGEPAHGVADGGEPPSTEVLEASTTGDFDEAVAGPATGFDLPALPVLEMPALELQPPALPTPGAPPRDLPEPDWDRFLNVRAPVSAPETPSERAATLAASAVRVRTPVLERMVGLSGEVSVTRSRIEAGVHQIRSSLGDLTDNLARLREQLRDIELQAETQMSTRREAARAAAQPFDPLEFDRFTRFQELTRMMAESVNDVGTVYRNLQRAVESAEDELAAQARLTRELQDDLLRTRMVEFESLSERLYRVVRQAAKETGKQVRLDIVGGSIEVDRGVLDRMTPAFEHLLRNCVTHGIEMPDVRAAAGKDPTGQITVVLRQEGNEVAVEFRDDGAGLNLARIRERGVALGLVAPDAELSDAEIAQLIYTPGFSTAEQVTELAGRGVGMDVVRSEVVAMGGRIETATAAGQGTSFKLVLPLTTAVTQVVMLRCGDTRVAVPSTLIELVKRVPADSLEPAYRDGAIDLGGDRLPFFWLGALLDESARSAQPARNATLVVVRSAQQRVVLHVDEVVGNQEAVVKNLGPQLSRLPGLAGMTLLASGMPALIYNPVALAAVYGDAARERMRAGRASQGAAAATAGAGDVAPLVLVVDDSLTVRRVTQRLLAREGYRVALAKDGLEALERLADEMPAVVLSDIEMPRMDGFDLVRNLRADARWRHLPVIMITSRIAQKHRDVAAQLGVDHYLGKPYSEDELLERVARYARLPVAV
jgi:chemosensory pili system protein ChpA (sensor histidine kinase/response regulator)